MEKQEMEIISTTTSSSSLPILPRLDRVDRLLQFLEERHNKKINVDVNWSSVENKSVPMSSAMEEVHYRGTLMDRLATLENRVLQLWVALEVEDRRDRHQHHHDHVDQTDQDERNKMTWGSSSASTSTLEADHHHQLPIVGKRKHRRWKNIYHFRKWLSWFPPGC
ncbi:hypothetical protein L484_007047 [Morus notabilis]|uniref:Uncharacterized protein n=1 Tax=Morus notabilis TaxID=981085 RepID=W9RW05_9ROSA|nr:hypothetical protein L484_007047 [Morus notabilis]